MLCHGIPRLCSCTAPSTDQCGLVKPQPVLLPFPLRKHQWRCVSLVAFLKCMLMWRTGLAQYAGEEGGTGCNDMCLHQGHEMRQMCWGTAASGASSQRRSSLAEVRLETAALNQHGHQCGAVRQPVHAWQRRLPMGVKTISPGMGYADFSQHLPAHGHSKLPAPPQPSLASQETDVLPVLAKSHRQRWQKQLHAAGKQAQSVNFSPIVWVKGRLHCQTWRSHAARSGSVTQQLTSAARHQYRNLTGTPARQQKQ